MPHDHDKNGDAHKCQLEDLILSVKMKELKLTVVWVYSTISGVNDCMGEEMVYAVLFGTKPKSKHSQIYKKCLMEESYTAPEFWGLLESTGTLGPGVSSVTLVKQATPAPQCLQMRPAAQKGQHKGRSFFLIFIKGFILFIFRQRFQLLLQ